MVRLDVWSGHGHGCGPLCPMLEVQNDEETEGVRDAGYHVEKLDVREIRQLPQK